MEAEVVAPHAGVWIETPLETEWTDDYKKSRPTRACGLKRYDQQL